MPKAITIIGKILLVCAIIALMAGLAYWMSFSQGAPWWMTLAAESGILALILAALWLRRFLLRRREKQFIDRIIDQDNARIPANGAVERHQILELQENWKASVERLRQSKLRKKGNPLYALPWYMIFGETGTGKTSAVRNAGLDTPMTEITSVSGIGGTKNCDWYFFEQAIILDTAGRYAIPIDEGPDLDEWKKFLSLLARYRRREPVNGLILAIAADRLLQYDDDQLRHDGTMLRQRINHLMRTLGAKVPVYLLVTKMDLVYGFDDLSKELESGEMEQAMGYLNADNRLFWKDVFDEAVASIGSRLEGLRDSKVRKRAKSGPMLLFPAEFASLSGRVRLFLESVFRENSYQETPLLRGLFFSSALRKGVPVSKFLDITGVQPADVSRDPLPQKGLYLKDFFSSILPADRKAYLPLLEYSIWKRITSSLALSAWLSLCILLGGAIGASWLFNHSVIQEYRQAFSTTLQLSGEMRSDLMTMEAMRCRIDELHERNSRWKLPLFGFHRSHELEERVKREYCDLFEREFVSQFDRQLLNRIESGGMLASSQEKADLFAYLVLRIVTLQSSPEAIKEFGRNDFIPLSAQVMHTLHPEIEPEIANTFGNLYFAYVHWDRDTAEEELQLEILRNMLLSRLEFERNGSLEWLAYLRDLQHYTIRLDDFWRTGRMGTGEGQTLVHGAFTQNGRDRINSYVRLLHLALDGHSSPSGRVDTLKQEMLQAGESFWHWYRPAYYDAWEGFVREVPSGTALLENAHSWRALAPEMVTDENPYHRAIATAVQELSAFEKAGEKPAWADELMHLERIRRLAAQEEQSGKQGVKGAVAKGTLDLMGIGNDALGKKQAAAFADTLAQAKAWSAYASALKAIPVASMSRQQLAEAYADCFSYGSASAPAADSPFVALHASLNALDAALGLHRSGDGVLALLMGPLDYLLTYAAQESSCHLQQQWDETVRGTLVEEHRSRMARQLFDASGGTVWKFLDGAARPFIGATPQGYLPRRDFRGNQLRFTREFLGFLDQGASLPQEIRNDYQVTFTTLPASSNPEADVQPISVKLEVACSKKPFVLNNFNFPLEGSIIWSPEQCGQTTLTIAFPDFSVTSSYSGSLGFARFLNDFHDGQHTFAADEFPASKAHFDRHGITSVHVAYRIEGGEAVVRLLNSMPAAVPAGIVSCSREEQAALPQQQTTQRL